MKSRCRSLASSAAVVFALVPGLARAAASGVVIPSDMSIGGMFLQADWVVKLVMVGLLIASLVTWTVFIAKALELRRATAAEAAVHDQVIGLRSLKDAQDTGKLAATPLVREAVAELQLSADALHDGDGIKERVLSRFDRHEAAVARRMTRGVNILATIGATAPFVGLFGTVWGIMNSFIGIAEKQTTNLAVVAPGIAEALLATALGLVAAIPAVLAYNKISTDLSRFAARLEGFASEFGAILSRQTEAVAGGGDPASRLARSQPRRGVAPWRSGSPAMGTTFPSTTRSMSPPSSTSCWCC